MVTTFEYLAGIIDGDGCISMYRKKDPKASNGITYAPNMKIASKELAYLEKLQKSFGGTIWKGGIGQYKGTQLYHLWFSADKIREILPKIIPHLILKKKEAELLLEAIMITKNHRNKDYIRSGLDVLVDNLKALKLNRKEVT